MTQFRPLLAASLDAEADWAKIKYPLVVSPKVDGIRVVCHPVFGPVTRTLKQVPNQYIRTLLSGPKFSGLDGEIVVGSITAPDVFNRTQSAVMTSSEEPTFTYWVFDDITGVDDPYQERLGYARTKVTVADRPYVANLDFGNAFNRSDVERFEQQWLTEGYEGIMLRSPNAPYKFNRSTINQQHLIKLKRFKDAEAVVTGFAPLERNQNEAVKDLLGHTKRSSHQAGRVEDNLLGNLLVHHPDFGDFSIGSGFDTDLRRRIWDNQAEYLGKTVTFKYQETGIKDKPRFPIFKGFRGQE